VTRHTEVEPGGFRPRREKGGSKKRTVITVLPRKHSINSGIPHRALKGQRPQERGRKEGKKEALVLPDRRRKRPPHINGAGLRMGRGGGKKGEKII